MLYYKKVFLLIVIFSLIFWSNNVICGEIYKDKKAEAQIKISPGVGIGQISIGDLLLYVTKVMGKNKKKISFLKEKQIWDDYGYDTDQELLFDIGFDYFLEYNEDYNKTDYPIWKIYFKRDKVVYITLSSFIYNNIKSRKVGVPPQCYFWGSKLDMIKTLGSEYFEYADSANNINYFYFDKGISIVLTRDKIRTITIYKPLSNNQKIKFMKKFKE